MILDLAMIFVLPLMFHEEYLQSILVIDTSFPNFNAGMLEVLRWHLFSLMAIYVWTPRSLGMNSFP